MICITGDIHADLTRFQDKKIKRLKKGDVLFVCGDFGFLWDGSRKEKSILKSLGKKPYNIIFVDGCHENFSLLKEYEVTEWNGGKVRNITGNLMHAVRGSVFRIGDTKIFAFGGGQSDDKDIRRESNTWWEEELPTLEEIKKGKDELLRNDNIVDYIITHEPPASLRDFLEIHGGKMTEMHAFFNELRDTCKFKRWYFGKIHKNKTIPLQFQALFDEVSVIR